MKYFFCPTLHVISSIRRLIGLKQCLWALKPMEGLGPFNKISLKEISPNKRSGPVFNWTETMFPGLEAYGRFGPFE